MHPLLPKKLKELKKYILNFAHVESNSFTFEVDGDGLFFKHFEIDTIQNGFFKAKIDVVKSETLLNLHFEIKGNLTLICDRSLEEFDFPFATGEAIILKFGDHDEELASGIRMINRNQQQINVAQDIYELICLTIPMKKLHPKFLTEEYNENEGFVVYSTLKEEKDDIDLKIDPRWAALKSLK